MIANDLTKTLNRVLQDKKGDKYEEKSIGIDYSSTGFLKHLHMSSFNCRFLFCLSPSAILRVIRVALQLYKFKKPELYIFKIF